MSIFKFFQNKLKDTDNIAIRQAKELGLYSKIKNKKNVQPVTPRGRKSLEEWRRETSKWR